MILADTIAIFLSVIGVLLATNALWLFNQAVWGKQTEAAGDFFCQSPWKSFFLGLPILILTIIVVSLLSKAGKGPSEMLILVVISLFFLLASVGVSGFAKIVGQRLSVSGQSSWKQCSFGGAVLELAFILPILGWVVLFPIVTITGCGAAVRGILKARSSREHTDSLDDSKINEKQVESSAVSPKQ